ncbi:MAG: outer membrane lipoprotein-sorting protein [Polyangiales bacterium]
MAHTRPLLVMHRLALPLLAMLFVAAQSAALPAARADEGSLSADEIARKTLRADAFSWEGARTRLRMILTGADGKRQERSMEVVARRDKGLLQTMVRFFSPQELAGTAFLMREQQGGASEQYVYLSGLKRTRRIVGREREGSFMGSDFTYTDMQRVDPKQTHNVRLPDDKVGDAPTYVVESSLSADSGSSYSKLVSWVRKTDFVALRTRFFDKQGKPVKTLYARKVRDLEGKPVVVESRMQSENGHATELLIDSMERKDDLPETLFTPAALEHL